MISLVAPIFNEEENLPEFRRRAAAALDGTGEPWEIVFVNNGGIAHASGDGVILMDSDLQNPPEVIGEMVAQWKNGFAVVLGEWRS